MKAIALPSTALLAALALVGCAGTPSGGNPSPETGEETAAEVASAPVPLLSLTCADAIDLASVQEALGTVQPGIDPVRVPGGSWALSHVGMAQAGALDCYWGDDAAPQEQYPRYLSVSVLPDAAESWAAWQQELASWSTPFAGHGDAAFSDCGGSPAYLYCEYDVLIGTNWLRADVMNLDALEDAAPIILTLTDAVAAAEPAGAPWITAPGLPASCADWLTAAEISAAVGMDGIAEREFPLSMPIILNDALDDGLACSWSNSYSSVQAMPVQVAALPSAGWAWEAAWDKPRPEHAPTAPIDGLGDQAFGGCDPDGNVCSIDVLTAGTWITVDGNKQAGMDGLRRVAMTALANLAQ